MAPPAAIGAAAIAVADIKRRGRVGPLRYATRLAAVAGAVQHCPTETARRAADLFGQVLINLHKKRVKTGISENVEVHWGYSF